MSMMWKYFRSFTNYKDHFKRKGFKVLKELKKNVVQSFLKCHLQFNFHFQYLSIPLRIALKPKSMIQINLKQNFNTTFIKLWKFVCQNSYFVSNYICLKNFNIIFHILLNQLI